MGILIIHSNNYGVQSVNRAPRLLSKIGGQGSQTNDTNIVSLFLKGPNLQFFTTT